MRRGSRSLALLRAATAVLPADAELKERRDPAKAPAGDEDLGPPAGASPVGSVRRTPEWLPRRTK